MIKYKNILLLLISLLLSGLSLGQDSLSVYLKIAAENNPGLKAKFSHYMASMEKINQVGSLPDPQVAFAVFILPVETRLGPQQGKISLSQAFPWFGLLDAKEDVATENAKAKYEIFEQCKSQLYFDVKKLYYRLYFVEQSKKTTLENIAILNTLQQLSIVKYESGTVGIVDELRVEMEINDLEYRLHQLEDIKKLFTVQFNNLLNIKEDNEVVVPEELESIELNIDKKLTSDSIVSNNHLIKQLEHRILSWKNRETVAKKAGAPKFMVGMDYIFIGENTMSSASDNGKDALLLPKVSFSIPLYRKKYNSMIKESMLNLESTSFEKDEKINMLESLLEKNYIDHHDATDRIILYKKQIALARQSLELLITAYSTDGKNFEELLRIEKRLLNYQLAIEKARTDAHISLAFIDYLMGK